MKARIFAWLALACVIAAPLNGKTDVAQRVLESDTEETPDVNAVPVKESVSVFSSGASEVHKSMRIPCMVNMEGVLVAACEGRYSHGDQAENDIVVSISEDEGATWSKPVIAAKSDNGSTYNNPCLIYDSKTKQLVLLFQRYAKGVKERSGLPLDIKSEAVLRNFICFSKDGKEWTTPEDVTKSTRHDDCSTRCSGPNPGVLLKHGPNKGRLVIVFNEGVKFGNWHVTATYSDDHGKTWKMGGKSEAGHGINEVSSVETEHGGVLVVARKHGGPGGNVKRVVYSKNGGKTWGPVTYHKDLPCVGCQNGLTRYSFASDKSKGGKGRILFSAPKGPGRSNGIIKMSYDDGKSWPVEKSVGPGPFAYSTMCPLKPGYVGLLYESDGGNNIRFAKISIAWLTDGKDSGLAVPAKSK